MDSGLILVLNPFAEVYWNNKSKSTAKGMVKIYRQGLVNKIDCPKKEPRQKQI